MTNSVTFHNKTFLKMLFHAAKYPYSAVSGVLLGKHHSSSQDDVDFVDAVPLFHSQLGLAPMLEIALTLVEEKYKSKGLAVVGYYQANEHIKDNVPDFIAMKICEKIAENNNHAFLVMVDNRKTSLLLDSPPLTVSFLSHDGKWKNKEKTCVVVHKDGLELTSKLLEQRLQYEVYDFDNHLDDLSCDWFNSHINELLQTLQNSVS